MVEGETLQNPEDIEREIIRFYKNLYIREEEWRPSVTSRNHPRISSEDNSMLQSPFEEHKIWDSVRACAGDKAPGPDRFSMAFFNKCWEVVKDDVVPIFVALIPKKVGAKELRDFKPISLIGSIYKTILKLLIEKLKKDELQRKVDWLDTILYFNSKLLNPDQWGPTGFFQYQRGLRQGDPLFPFLFIIAMEGLNDLVKVAQTNEWIRGFKVSSRANSNMRISHLQYADDTLVFCEAESEHVKILRVIFILFEAFSGLHINWQKSFICPINEVPGIQNLANILGGTVGELPTVHLGMPLGAKSKAKGIWNNVLEKCERKLANWKNQYLSMGKTYSDQLCA
uniref:Reverse transcriptase domain-containing protein n=1 Tax=Nicotiana tabacum TaxID=4097 RepID=A0A1S3X7N5_TOBAC|nr:PREDICTED: uncharacterized protein LOC107762088 [Nicotiana tabacum]